MSEGPPRPEVTRLLRQSTSLKRPSLSSADSVTPGDFPELPFIVILGCSRVQTEVGGGGTFSFLSRRQTVPTSRAKVH